MKTFNPQQIRLSGYQFALEFMRKYISRFGKLQPDVGCAKLHSLLGFQRFWVGHFDCRRSMSACYLGGQRQLLEYLE